MVLMHAVIFIGLVIIFISSFFMLFIFSTLANLNVRCLGDPSNPSITECDFGQYGTEITLSVLMAGFFVLLDFGALYLMLNAASI
jgi:hypothetical protein